ncbi:holo-ACP synthase [Actinophytocola xanthii]|uniref:Holo-[acyl-carrier-protein] synthase n=2 Tax=Actinophytocola xanthii TaxID=1912961 RepID=A0A1Q8CL14_9PSEU|nr:holo-ACP synthase [Actinophytocola xanthii]
MVGVDLTGVGRVESLLAGQPGIEDEVFTPRELAYARHRRRPAEHLAARFAAKEAVFKAFGTGLGAGMRWRDVEVVNGASGRPRLHLHGAAAALAESRGVERMTISLSHSDGIAIAFVALTAAAGGTS